MTKPIGAVASLMHGGVQNPNAASSLGVSIGPIAVRTLNVPLQSFGEILFAEGNHSPPAQGLLAQSPSEPLVKPTLQPFDESGVGLALGPDSEFPVAIRFKGKTNRGASHVIILRPGQRIWPYGRETYFEGFEAGVPAGWMGGGWASLHILKSPKSDLDFGPVEKEVLYHRLQLRIRAASADAPMVNGNFPANWPMQFPWPRAFRGMYLPNTTTVSGRVADQNGQPTVGLRKHTRTLLRLRGGVVLTGVANDNYFRMVFWGTDHFEALQDGVSLSAVGSINNFFQDLFWPANAAVDPTMPAHNPILEVPGSFSAQKAQIYGVSLDAPAGSALVTQVVDVLRYGIL